MKFKKIIAFTSTLWMSTQSPKPPRDEKIRKIMYGEWLIWHSSHPQLFPSRILKIYPRKELILHHSKYIGPFLCKIENKGRYFITNTQNETTCRIKVDWMQQSLFLESIFGIGINEMLKIKYSSPSEITRFDLCIDIMDKNDIYLSSQEDDWSVHLVRNIGANNNQENFSYTPLSTFIVTQMLGNLLFNLLHQYFSNYF